MAELLFRLRSVPEDEAAEIRALLEQHRVGYYETDAGNWGISMPGIWVNDADELPRARALLDDYQWQRRQAARRVSAADGAPGHWQRLRQRATERPLAVVSITVFCALLLYAMIVPFVRLALAPG